MKIKNEIIKSLTEKIIKETKIINNILQFIQDSGAYKERQKYHIPDYEYKEKIKQFKNNIIMFQSNIIIAEYVISNNKKLQKQYDLVMKAVIDEAKNRIIVKQQGEDLKKN